MNMYLGTGIVCNNSLVLIFVPFYSGVLILTQGLVSVFEVVNIKSMLDKNSLFLNYFHNGNCISFMSGWPLPFFIFVT